MNQINLNTLKNDNTKDEKPKYEKTDFLGVLFAILYTVGVLIYFLFIIFFIVGISLEV